MAGLAQVKWQSRRPLDAVPYADRSARRSRPEQVPAVAGNIDEDGDLTVWLAPGVGDELDARSAHPVIGGLEVVDAQEQPDAARELVTDRARLTLSAWASSSAVVAAGGRTTTHRFGRPSLVKDGESTTSSKPKTSTKNRMASS